MNDLQLIAFIKERERIFNEHTTAKEKWLSINKYIPYLKMYKRDPMIIDAGGEEVTASIIKNWFPTSSLFTINISIQKDKATELSRYIKADLETDRLNKFFDKPVDIVFLMDVIEHLMDPDSALKNILEILDNNGYLFISTPNLADLYNRFFLFFGYSLHNYNVSQWYKTGNPFIKDLSGKRHGNHKSVFTVKQLKEMLEKIYKMEIIFSAGYSYYESDWLDYYSDTERIGIKKEARIIGHVRIRELINTLLPNSLREGILLIARK